MLNWLERNVTGLETQIACKNYASDLVKERLVIQAVTKKEFTNQCYYTFNEELTSLSFFLSFLTEHFLYILKILSITNGISFCFIVVLNMIF